MRPLLHNFSAYANDTWKASRRLTLNLGVRWEVNPGPTTDGDGPQFFGVNQVHDVSAMALAPVGTPVWKTTWANFAPRLGASYLLIDSPASETVVRGGFGVYYDTGNNNALRGVSSNFPYASSRNNLPISFPLTVAALAPAPIPAVTGVVPSQIPVFEAVDPELLLPYTLQWNVAVQRALGKEQTLTVSYVGASGHRLLQRRTLQLNRPMTPANPRFTTVSITTNKATSDYHAMQVSFQRRLSKGLQAMAGYTWAHAIDEDSTSLADVALKRGNASFDIRHVFNTAVSYDIPTVPFLGKFGRAVFGGWSVDTRVQVQSAFPLDVVVGGTTFDPLDGSAILLRPNVIPGVPFYVFDDAFPGGRGFNRTVPTAAQLAAAGCAQISASTPAKGAFCTPLAGSEGNLGRNALRGLPAWQADMALSREFGVTERVKLIFRAEAFNVFNHPNFGAINTSVNSSIFGEAQNMLNTRLGGLNALYQFGGPRSMQFAFKVKF